MMPDNNPTSPVEAGDSMPLLSHSPFFLGLRYLQHKKLSYLAMIAVAVSVGTLIIVMSVMSGFEQQLRGVVRGYLSDVTIKPTSGGLHGFEDWEDKRQDILEMSHVEASAPFIEAPSLLRVPDSEHMSQVMFRGIAPDLETEVTDFGDEFIQSGELSDLDRTYIGENNSELNACLIGSEMAKQWSPYYQLYQHLSDHLEQPHKERILSMLSDVRAAPSISEARDKMQEVVNELWDIDSNLAQLAAANRERSLRDEIVLITATDDLRRRLQKFVVAGVFQTGRYDYDSGVVLVSLASATDFVKSDGGVTGLNLKLDDFKNAPGVKQQLSRDFNAQTWEDQQRNFLEAVHMERTLMGLILSFVGLLAGFCIFAILIMTVYEKRRDIGILKAVGYTPNYIAMIFLVDGGAVGVIGALIGVTGGLSFAGNINPIADFIERMTGWTPFPQDVYYFTEIPANRGLAMPAYIAAGAILCSLLFSVLPAIKAARMDPVDTLRFE
ncbi:MAG: FtsX-like permease family protein [Planctomycetota bacterium]